MKIKAFKKIVVICILTIINLVFYSCSEVASDSIDDIKITIETDDDDINNIQVYTVNGWKYVQDGLSVTVESDFKMKFIQIQDDKINYYYYSNLIATAEGSTFTIEDMYSDDETTVQVWRSSRSYPFEVTPSELDYYKVSFGDTITSLGTVTYQTPYITVTAASRVDYNEDQSPYLEYITRESGTTNYFGNWDYSNDSAAVLNTYTDIEIYVNNKTYNINSGVLTLNSETEINLTNLTEK